MIYLGVKSFRDKSGFVINRNKVQIRTRTIFIQGILSNILNPKIALFFMAFLPQFVKPEYGNVPYQMAYLGLTFALFGIVFFVIIGYFSGGIGSWLYRKQFLAGKIQRLTGSILIALGLRLAFIQRSYTITATTVRM